MNPVRLLQFTDCHLFQTDSGKLCGLNTLDSLDAVLKTAQDKHWPPDLVLVTGDLCQDESQKSYSRFRSVFEKLNVPVYCLPGNHDAPSLMKKTFNKKHVRFRRNFTKGGWQLVFLDSRIPKSTKGHLTVSELEHLKKCLKKNPRHHVLVSLHHQPIPVGSLWLDSMKVNNGEALFKILEGHPASKLVVFGHVHQEFSGHKGGIPTIGAPSTCIQFTPRIDNFALDAVAPGYRWITLYSDGRFETGVERVAGYSLAPDLSSKGY